jgi:hypothetical protein
VLALSLCARSEAGVKHVDWEFAVIAFLVGLAFGLTVGSLTVVNGCGSDLKLPDGRCQVANVRVRP